MSETSDEKPDQIPGSQETDQTGTDAPAGAGAQVDSSGAADTPEQPDESASAAQQPEVPGVPPQKASQLDLPELGEPAGEGANAHRVTMLNDVNLRVEIELGRTRMLVEDVLQLGEGSVVELDKLAGDPVDVYVNDRLIARGEILVLNDSFCVRVSDVLTDDPHRISE